MTSTQTGRLVCACVAFIAAASNAAAQDKEREEQVEMSVDVSITHTVIDQHGNLVLPPQVPTLFSVARTRRAGAWQTVVTYGTHAGAPTRASSHPLEGARVVFDETSGETRFYDAAGSRNPLLSNDPARALRTPQDAGSGRWLEGLVATAATRSTRSRELQERYGNAVGRVRALDRFIAQRDGVVEEVLADPASAVAVEINSMRDGVLESHVVFEYERRSDAAMVRRRMRSETRLPGEAGHRAQTVVEFMNLRTGGQ